MINENALTCHTVSPFHKSVVFTSGGREVDRGKVRDTFGILHIGQAPTLVCCGILCGILHIGNVCGKTLSFPSGPVPVLDFTGPPLVKLAWPG